MGNSDVSKVKSFNKKKLFIFSIIVLVIALCLVYFLTNKDISEDEELIVQGSLETTETDLNSKLAGIVDQVLVQEGDKVKKGDTLIVISSDTIEAKKKQAEAAKLAAEAQAEKAANGARSQEVAQAKAAYDYAEKTYNRIKTLYDEDAIPAAKYDEIYAQYISAKQTYDMAVQGAREEDKLAANAQVAQADAAIAEVNSYLEDAVIKASMDGTVTSLNVNQGNLISTGMPLLTLTSDEKPWVEINVKETDLSMVKEGKEVKVTLTAYPGEEFKGVVKNINKNPDFATKRATNNNGDFDILSYGVKIELSDMEQEVYPGLTAMVDLGKKTGE
ncbi:HlyD family secretion protein [Anaerovorax odorimutans]|uniref:HlyD family secretion protein n=1 Tax=Anaerovorax odorimutans TaxID=109327 RepID=UPI0003FAE63F|nr:efflux RND transporter periplasmic adaptor subunit [Anaerovorax odorimutans]